MADRARLSTPPRRPARSLTAAETARLLSALNAHPLRALFVLKLASGMRIGEVLALLWEAIDFDPRTVSVRQSVATSGPPALKMPKSGRARRVRLPPQAVDVLRTHRAAQVPASPWCFPDADAPERPLGYEVFYRVAWLPLKHAAALPAHAHPHTLRHTYATLQMLAHTPTKVVQEALGHSSIAITQDLYSDVLPEMQERAADAMQAILGQLGRDSG